MMMVAWIDRNELEAYPVPPTNQSTNPPIDGLTQAAAKCEATLKRVREVKKGYNYEMRMSLKNDPRRFEYAEVRAGGTHSKCVSMYVRINC
jgi:hypothetical protein